MSLLNKNTLPNLAALALIAISFAYEGPVHTVLLNIGLFALSGALTNWIAIHMLFERVPGFYGSGVIALHFTEFKSGIMSLVTQHLFKKETVDAAFSGASSSTGDKAPADNAPGGAGTSEGGLDIGAAIDSLDLDAAYDQLKTVIMESSFGAMLAMVGGEQALEPMRQPFKDRMQRFLAETTKSPRFQAALNQQLSSMAGSEQFMKKIIQVVETRLDELTPEMVRDIIQEMIRKHLGWLVVWGGVFGGLIGAASSLFLLNS